MTIDLGRIKFNWCGTYNSGTSYIKDDVVFNNNSSWICILATTGNNPQVGSLYWNIMTQGGGGGGATIYSGSGIPSSGLGNPGDIYIDVVGDGFFWKTNSGWHP